jgi:holliday junction DNA helicase RuvA
MIEFLRGRLAHKQPARLVIDVGGVGFGVDVSLRTAEAFPREGETVELLTYLHVKEEILELYGFKEEVERTLFHKLLGVSGIGPRLALRILSALPPWQLARMIVEGDIRSLTALKGIGKKTAEVMVASLRTSLAKLDLRAPTDSPAAAASPGSEAARDAVLALITLGVKDGPAQNAVQKALEKLGKDSGKASTSQIITQALQEV